MFGKIIEFYKKIGDFFITEQEMMDRACRTFVSGKSHLTDVESFLKETEFDNNALYQLLISRNRLDLAVVGFIRPFDTLVVREKFHRDAEKELGIARLVGSETLKRKSKSYAISLYNLALSDLKDVARFLQKTGCDNKVRHLLLISINRFELALASFTKTSSNKL